MIAASVLFLAVCFLAYSNGANDNFKGVATLFGSGTTNYRRAVRWATATTFAGSVASIFLAESLLENFSGKGLVPDAVIASPSFLIAVGTGAGATVLFATIAGFPVSTTHGVTGALAGAGLAAAGAGVDFARLGKSFFLPLFASPLLALALGIAVYVAFHRMRMATGITKEWCFCIGEQTHVVPVPLTAEPLPFRQFTGLRVMEPRVDTAENCVQRYAGRFFGARSQDLLDGLHYLSAGLVSFARGLSDTPKIMALSLSLKALGVPWGMSSVALCMAAGGLLSSRKVAQTMSKRITPLNHGQGFSANLVTAALVLFASGWGLPVSTTHVSVGALFGIGLVTGKTDLRVVRDIVLSWLITLPLAAAISAAAYGAGVFLF